MKQYKIIGPVIIVSLWWLATQLSLVNTFLLPSPGRTISNLILLVMRGEIASDLFATCQRVILAFLLAVVIGIPTGFVFGYWSRLYRSSELVIDFFRSIPATAIFPLFLLLFGIGDRSKILVAAFSAALIIVFNTAQGVLNSKKSRLVAAKIMGASPLQLFWFVLIWESLPQILIGLKTAASLTMVVIVVTEMVIGTTVGLGRKIIDYQYIFDVPAMYAVILTVGVIGYILNQTINLIERKYTHWVGR